MTMNVHYLFVTSNAHVLLIKEELQSDGIDSEVGHCDLFFHRGALVVLEFRHLREFRYTVKRDVG